MAKEYPRNQVTNNRIIAEGTNGKIVEHWMFSKWFLKDQKTIIQGFNDFLLINNILKISYT